MQPDYNPHFINFHYSVYPRYTAGSPAQVPAEIARQLVVEEKSSYERYLTGVYGEEDKAMAQREGLAGIAEEVWERYSKLYYHDMLTDVSGLKKNRHKGG